MDKKSVIRIIRKYLAFLKNKNYKIEQTYLFGSFAKENYHPDSDIDIALVMKGLKNSFLMQGDLMFLGRNIDTRIEPHPFDEKDFNDNNPVVDQILKTGIRIF